MSAINPGTCSAGTTKIPLFPVMFTCTVLSLDFPDTIARSYQHPAIQM